MSRRNEERQGWRQAETGRKEGRRELASKGLMKDGNEMPMLARARGKKHVSQPSQSAIDVELCDNWSISRVRMLVVRADGDDRQVSCQRRSPATKDSAGWKQKDRPRISNVTRTNERNFQRADETTARWMNGGDGTSTRVNARRKRIEVSRPLQLHSEKNWSVSRKLQSFPATSSSCSNKKSSKRLMHARLLSLTLCSVAFVTRIILLDCK